VGLPACDGAALQRRLAARDEYRVEVPVIEWPALRPFGPGCLSSRPAVGLPCPCLSGTDRYGAWTGARTPRPHAQATVCRPPGPALPPVEGRQAQGMGGGSPPGVTVQGYDAESGVGALTKALADLPANGV